MSHALRAALADGRPRTQSELRELTKLPPGKISCWLHERTARGELLKEERAVGRNTYRLNPDFESARSFKPRNGHVTGLAPPPQRRTAERRVSRRDRPPLADRGPIGRHRHPDRAGRRARAARLPRLPGGGHQGRGEGRTGR